MELENDVWLDDETIADSKDSEFMSKYTQYIIDGDNFVPVQKCSKTLPSGYYRIGFNDSTQQVFFIRQNIIMPKLYTLPNSLHRDIMADIDHFWASKERYKAFGNVYKRNILVYSVPGTGKTSLINLLIQDLIKKRKGIVIQINKANDLVLYPLAMKYFRGIEGDRPVILVMEDFDSLLIDEQYKSAMLNLLDGTDQFDNVVTIATTNHPEKISEQFSNRPSRFNLIIEYGKPSAKVRKFYIESKLREAGIDVKKIRDDIARYVSKSSGYTMDHLKELVQGIFVDELPEDDVFSRIDAMIEKRGLYKTNDDFIGAGRGDDEGWDDEVDGTLPPLPTPKRKIGFV